MKSHLLLPSALVKPLILHLLHRTTLDAKIVLWIYGNEDVAQDLNNYNILHSILSEHMGGEVIAGITDVRTIHIPDDSEVDSFGINKILAKANSIVEKQLSRDIKPDDEVIILTKTQLGLGVALAFKYHNILRKSPRVVSTISLNEAASISNIDLLYNSYDGNIRIDLIAQGRITDILSVARAVEAVEPPDEPNGIYLTELQDASFYYWDTDLPTPVTSISMRTLKQLRHNLQFACSNTKFLEKTKVSNSFPHFSQLTALDGVLSVIERYLDGIRNDLRTNYQPEDMSSVLMKLPSMSDGSASETYCRKAFGHVLSCSFTNMETVNEGTGAKLVNLPTTTGVNVNFLDCINPFYAAQLTKEAFANLSEENKEVRSKCLDIWELLYNNSDDSTIHVEEEVINMNDSKMSCYRTLPMSENMFSQKVIYRVYLNNRLVAISSPSTGFAPIVSLQSSTEIKDLSQRSKEFKQFVYYYVMNVGGFANEFKDYVSCSCSTAELKLSDGDLFENYPYLGEKIPIY